MARPRTINPNGATKPLFVMLPIDALDKIRLESKKQNISMAEFARRILVNSTQLND